MQLKQRIVQNVYILQMNKIYIQVTATIWEKKAKEGHADQESVKKKEYLKQRQRGGKRLCSLEIVRIVFFLIGVIASLSGIRNYILNFTIDEEDAKYNAKQRIICGVSFLALWFILGK